MTLTGEKAVPLLALDLVGTVIEGPDDDLGHFVNTPADVRVFPAAVTMMRRWTDGGGRVIIVSNQGGVATGHLTTTAVEQIMMRTWELCDRLPAKVAWCAHHPDASHPEMARCWCRKPSPGLVVEAKIRLNARFPGEYYPSHLGLFVGDRPEDEECARLAGMDFIWAKDWRAQAG